jgi:hypothetical protein
MTDELKDMTDHAPRATAELFVKNLCGARHGGCVCERYAEHVGRHVGRFDYGQHHCECGKSWVLAPWPEAMSGTARHIDCDDPTQNR